jgi:HAD superfamily hydrolase (TIGR01490 family)
VAPRRKTAPAAKAATAVRRKTAAAPGARRGSPNGATARARGAFFDVDKTILSQNSGTLFVKYLYEQGRATRLDLVKGLASYLQYKVNILDIDKFTKQTVKQLKGQSEAEMLAFCAKWYEEIVRNFIYPEARALIGRHLERGDVVALVTGATRYVAEPLAKDLGIDHTICTQLEVRNGMFTGRAVEPICFGAGKIYRLEKFVEGHRIDLALSYFYTDSISDLPLLEIVGHPQVVNPDPLLYRRATRRKWPISMFKSSWQ